MKQVGTVQSPVQLAQNMHFEVIKDDLNVEQYGFNYTKLYNNLIINYIQYLIKHIMAQLSISAEADKKLNSLKKALARPKKIIVEQSINYLHKLSLDPEDVTTGDPSGEVKKLKNTLVSFIRTQEKKLVKPTLEFSKYSAEKIDKLIESFSKYSVADEKFKNSLVGVFKDQNSKLNLVVEERRKGETYAQEMKHRVISFLLSRKDSIGRAKPSSDYLKIITELKNDL